MQWDATIASPVLVYWRPFWGVFFVGGAALPGRKRKTTPTVMRKIAERLAEGETLIDICKGSDMPSYRAVTDAIIVDER